MTETLSREVDRFSRMHVEYLLCDCVISNLHLKSYKEPLKCLHFHIISLNKLNTTRMSFNVSYRNRSHCLFMNQFVYQCV
jgi:hypothetical protein